MRVPISWLKDYVDITLPIPELAETLTLAGLEVEKIDYFGIPGSELVWDRERIFIGELLKVERHPNADKLTLATVNYGPGREITVVTGAPNIAPGDSGQKVVLALKGSRLYDGHKEGRVLTTLKEAMLRGIKNDSMVCSEKELGLSDEHEGIILLPADAPVGAPLQDYLGDAVLEIAILPNIARCTGILGVAREVAALTGQKIRYPDTTYVEDAPEDAADLVQIVIENPALNPRFTASVIRDAQFGPSPYWMQRRLQMCGVRAISNVVDVSNYVMLELGQPTHTFDYDQLAGTKKTIGSRLATPGESMATLDGKKRELLPTDIVVMEPGRAISLAGVMGGGDTEISASTRNILLEIAAWDPVSLRRTVRHHQLPSDASFRFIRGVHPEMTMLAQRRALHLLQRYAGGKIARGIVDAYPQPAQAAVIDLDPAESRRLLGVEIPVPEMRRILESLEFIVADGAAGGLRVTAPAHRLDIEGAHDLIEEIGRIYGYNRLPNTLMVDEIPPAHDNGAYAFEERLKDALADCGLQEIVSHRLTTLEAESRLLPEGTPPDDRPYVTLKNPISSDRLSMRHTLASGLLDAVASNARHHARIALFELGSVYLPSEDGVLPDEQPRLAIALCGSRGEGGWEAAARAAAAAPMDFFSLKGVIETAMSALGIPGARFEPVAHPSFHPGRTAALLAKDGARLGLLGELHPRVREVFGLPESPTILADLDVNALRAAVSGAAEVVDPPRFPAVVEDLAVIVNEDVPAAQIEQTVIRAGGNLLRGARLFDVYRGEQIGAGKKSLAFSLTYQADDRTLTDKDIEKPRAKIIRAVEGQLGGTIRKG